MFCLDTDVLGTEKPVFFTDKNFVFIDDLPTDVYLLSNNHKNKNRDLQELLCLSAVTLDLNPPEKFRKAMQQVSKCSRRFPWQKIMPTQEFQSFMAQIQAQLAVFVDKLAYDYYNSTWLEGNHVLENLQPAAVKLKLQKLSKFISNHMLVNFIPNDDGYIKVPVYDRLSTRTGRLIIKQGPNYLTLKKSYRKLLESRFKNDGMLLMLDFSAIEVRVLLYEAGVDVNSNDLYTEVGEKMFKGLIDRSTVKRAMIAELYGQNKYMLGKSLNMTGKPLINFIRTLEQLFKKDVLLNRLKKKYIETNSIENRYGRRIVVNEPADHIFINSYAQSTAVDVALTGFSKLIKQFDSNVVAPIAVIHDALILDCHRTVATEIQNIKQIHVNGYVQSFPIKIEQL